MESKQNIIAAGAFGREPCLLPTATPLFRLGRKRADCYAGIVIKADSNVHSHICEMLRVSRHLERPMRIVDLGCGAGALSQRLADLGHDVLSVDMDREAFAASTPHRTVDFNSKTSVDAFIAEFAGTFDIVVVAEVIEHVHNPWELMNQVHALAKPDGIAIVSTPNTGSVLSRAVFLLTGNIFQFEPADLAYGHITPVSHLKMAVITRETGWKISAWAAAGSLPVVWLGPSVKYLVYSMISVLARPFLRGTKNGWCLIFLCEKEQS